MSEELKTTTLVKIGEKDYVIKFPNVGQLMSIESKKILLSGDTYRELVRNGTTSSKFNLDLIDAISCFSVLIDGLAKDLDVKNYLELDAVTGKAIVKAYKTQFYPWYKEFLEMLYTDNEE